MGCFNTVRMKCPSCGGMTDYQSKLGSCRMEEFGLSDVPLLELADVKDECDRGRLYCEHCNAKLVMSVTVSVRLFAENDNPNELTRTF